MTTIEFENPSGDIVEKVTVVRDGDDRTFVLLDMLFEPGNRFGIEMIGRFIEQQNVRFLQQQTA